jgi:hypothetical protein
LFDSPGSRGAKGCFGGFKLAGDCRGINVVELDGFRANDVLGEDYIGSECGEHGRINVSISSFTTSFAKASVPTLRTVVESAWVKA